jgi:hypothetical protein
MAASAPASRSHSHVPVRHRGEQPDAAEVSSDGYADATTEALWPPASASSPGPADDIDEALRFCFDLLGTGNATVHQRRSDGRCLS